MSSFTADEIKEVHKRLSAIIASGSQELADMEGLSAFVTGLDMESEQQLLISAAVSTRSRRNRGAAVMTAEQTKAECQRICAEIEAQMGRTWLKKHDLQVQEKMLAARADR